MKIENAGKDDGRALAELRALSMRESLEEIGRYDPVRVRERFLVNFDPDNTKKIVSEGVLVGFYVVLEKPDHIYLDHMYILPRYQGKKYGSIIMEKVIKLAKERGKPVRLGALKQSRSNQFYLAHGFRKTHEEEYDIYYELRHS